MTSIIHFKSQMSGRINNSFLVKGILLGAAAGLAGTFSMDLCMMATTSILGLGATFCFSAVGDTAAAFFSSLSIQINGGVLMGLAIPYLVGALIGALYSLIVMRFPALRTCSLKRSILGAVLFVEILAQPMVWMTPIFLKMALADALEWFIGALVMHLTWGIVLGLVIHYGLRSDTLWVTKA